MQKEIVNLLKKEKKVSEETLNEIHNIDLNDFSNIVKEIGKSDTEYIKASEISKDLNTEYVGQNLYVYKEVSSTNTLAKFLSLNDVENGTVIKADCKDGLYIKAKEGIIEVLEIQGENAKRMNINDFLRGTELMAGSKFE